MVKDGFGACFIKVFYGDTELTQSFTKLRYIYDEEGDDDTTLVFETVDRDDPDKPYFQPKAELTIVWGFIGGDSKRRKVYVENPAWQFQGKDTIKCTLTCAEKGTSLKGATDNKIYKNKSLPQIIKEKADKHGLKSFIEVDKSEIEFIIEPKPGESLDAFLIRNKYETESKKIKEQFDEYKNNPNKARVDMQKFLESSAQASKDTLANKERELRLKYQQDWADGAPIDVEATVARDMALYKMSLQFKIYKNQPQANKSDKQFMDGIAKREPNGPYMVDTRDDGITLRKRTYTRRPVISYEYGSGDGMLIDFSPETKRKSRKGSSTGMGFNGWNALDKSFFSGTATAADGDPSLAKAIEMLNYYKGVQKKGGGALVTGKRVGKEFLPFINDLNVASKIDNAGVYTRRRMVADITVDDQVSALDKAIKDFNDEKDARRKEMYNALGINPPDAYSHAANLRRNSELNKNPASALVWGNPALECGMIVTILGVSKKYSGNYYIKKATHEVDTSGGYVTDLEMARQGDNIKTNEDYADSREIARPLNTKVAPNTDNTNTKTVKTKGNPTNTPKKKEPDVHYLYTLDGKRLDPQTGKPID